MEKAIIPDAYVRRVISRYSLPVIMGAAPPGTQLLRASIKKWAGKYCIAILPSGSYAKNTRIKGSTDIDIFVSLRSVTPGTCEEIYISLLKYLQNAGFEARAQNVSIGVKYNGLSIDVIPAKHQLGSMNDHSLFSNKTQTWLKTNIYKHIRLVRESHRLTEIKVTKIWRDLNKIDFPSFYLELTVLHALKCRLMQHPAANFITVLEYLRDEFPNARVVDPSNTANIVSDDLSESEKTAISEAAAYSREQSSWDKVIW